MEPDGWYTKKADVKIRIKDVNGTGWETVETKTTAAAVDGFNGFSCGYG